MHLSNVIWLGSLQVAIILAISISTATTDSIMSPAQMYSQNLHQGRTSQSMSGVCIVIWQSMCFEDHLTNLIFQRLRPNLILGMKRSSKLSMSKLNSSVTLTPGIVVLYFSITIYLSNLPYPRAYTLSSGQRASPCSNKISF